jgi:hypothetical protein
MQRSCSKIAVAPSTFLALALALAAVPACTDTSAPIGPDGDTGAPAIPPPVVNIECDGSDSVQNVEVNVPAVANCSITKTSATSCRNPLCRFEVDNTQNGSSAIQWESFSLAPDSLLEDYIDDVAAGETSGDVTVWFDCTTSAVDAGFYAIVVYDDTPEREPICASAFPYVVQIIDGSTPGN